MTEIQTLTFWLGFGGGVFVTVFAALLAGMVGKWVQDNAK